MSAATSAETVGICTSPDMNEEELLDGTWAAVDEEVF